MTAISNKFNPADTSAERKEIPDFFRPSGTQEKKIINRIQRNINSIFPKNSNAASISYNFKQFLPTFHKQPPDIQSLYRQMIAAKILNRTPALPDNHYQRDKHDTRSNGDVAAIMKALAPKIPFLEETIIDTLVQEALDRGFSHTIQIFQLLENGGYNLDDDKAIKNLVDIYQSKLGLSEPEISLNIAALGMVCHKSQNAALLQSFDTHARPKIDTQQLETILDGLQSTLKNFIRDKIFSPKNAEDNAPSPGSP